MRHPLGFLLQFIAWLFLFAMLLVTWAGVTYPNGRTKAYPPEFSMIHPMCIHRIFFDEQYEGRTSIPLCHAEYINHPIAVSTIDSDLGAQTCVQVTSTSTSPESGKYTVGYHMEHRDQTGPLLITLFHRFPDGETISAIAGLTHDPLAKTLEAHFLERGNDHCEGGFIEVMGMASAKELAYS